MQTITPQVSLVLLAGGKGSRFNSKIPKQFILFRKEPLILYPLRRLLKIPNITETIVVCAPEFRELFSLFDVRFADPGKERQDSVLSGVQKASNSIILVHDGARPCIYPDEVQSLILAGQHCGAATIASPMAYTVKQRRGDNIETLDRSNLFIAHTPQCLRKDILCAGIYEAQKRHQILTDDVAAAEILSLPSQLIISHRAHIKITYPQDMQLLETLL